MKESETCEECGDMLCFGQCKKEETTTYDFAAAMKANAEKKAKLKKERLNSNKSVLKSYRIK
jgi:hypothetical protein